MVEMTEVANILGNATQDSLSSWIRMEPRLSTVVHCLELVVEYIADRKIIGAKTLFATHYHELTELEGDRRRQQLLYCGQGKI